jgi:hypothetical protein
MRAREFINEVQTGGIEKQYREPEADGGGGGSSSWQQKFKDKYGVDMPSAAVMASGMSGMKLPDLEKDPALKKAIKRSDEKLKESTYQEHEEQLRDFVAWCVDQLNIKQALPKIRFQDAKEGPDQHHTGYYDDAEDVMWIYTGNRNLIDIMRTVAHELTHRKQYEDNRVNGDQAYPGSPVEQEADAVAGYLMKLYGKANPEIIE